MIKEDLWQGVRVYKLQSDKLTVSLCPSLGNNVYSIRDEGQQRELLRVPDYPETLANQPILYGTPMMLPPNRIREGKFHFQGKSYQFDINMPSGHHIHGVIKNLPWKVTSYQEKDGACSITSSFSTADFPEVLRQYPHELQLEMTYELTNSRLTQTVRVSNAGNNAAPFGFGLHTWFLIDGEPGKWTLRLPVSGIWELDGDNIPTGRIVPLREYAEMVGNQGINLKGLDLDTVFQVEEGSSNVAVLAREDYEIRYSTSQDYKQWVIYTKGVADEFICLEPYTWVTNAPNLDADAELTGLRAIEPGDSLQLEVLLEVIHKS